MQKAAIVSLLLIACAEDLPAIPKADPPPAVGTNGTSTMPCDVGEILAKNCQSCHSAPPKYGAPMPLVTYDDLHRGAVLTAGKKVYEVVGERIHDEAAPMPQPPNARLSAEDAAVIDAWVAAKAPAEASSCGTTTTAAVGPDPLSCSPDQLIRPSGKFAVQGTADEYVCYGFDTSSAAKRHVIAGGPHIDNPNVVHHVLLYQAEDAVSPTPVPCGSGGGKNWRLVTGWALGGKNFELPPEAGFAEESGTTHWAIQIHYNNAIGRVGELDGSGYDLCSTTELRPNDADILATGTVQIQIPPRSTQETTCDVVFPESYGKINVVSSWAHMHRLGRAQSAKRVRDGAEMTLLDAPSFDFNTGGGANGVNVDVSPGDTLRTMCRWQNTTDDTVGFGEETADEMCFAFLTYYPKITTPRFRWAAPASPIVTKCTSTAK